MEFGLYTCYLFLCMIKDTNTEQYHKCVLQKNRFRPQFLFRTGPLRPHASLHFAFKQTLCSPCHASALRTAATAYSAVLYTAHYIKTLCHNKHFKQLYCATLLHNSVNDAKLLSCKQICNLAIVKQKVLNCGS